MQSMRIPTDHDLQHYPHVLFTSPDIWDTSVLDHGIPPSLPETQTSPTIRLVPPQGEDQPHDLISDVFVYGRSNLDASDNDFSGRPFLLPLDENGERKRAIIYKHVNDIYQPLFHLTYSPRITTMEVPTVSLLSGRLGSNHGKPRIATSGRELLFMTRNTSSMLKYILYLMSTTVKISKLDL